MSDGLFVPFKAKLGRPPKYTPGELLKQFEKYIADRQASPIVIGKVTEGQTGNNGTYSETREPHPQLLSIGDFCVFLGTSRNWWNELGEDFLGVKDYIRTYIETFQLKGATAGIFNANIVARLLGLADKKEIQATGDNMTIVVKSEEEKKKIEGIAELGV